MATKKRRQKVSNADLARIARAAVAAMGSDASFTRSGLSFEASGKPAKVLSPEAVRCDALGWILKSAHSFIGARHFYAASELINAQIVFTTGRSLVSINDEDGREAVVAALENAARHFEECSHG